jgi:hypothetical protein
VTPKIKKQPLKIQNFDVLKSSEML